MSSSDRHQVVPYHVVNPDGTTSTVLVEVEADPHAGPRPISRDALGAAHETFRQALDRVRPALQEVSTTLQTLNNPDAVTVEFGLKLTVNAGVILASTASEVTFKVTICWRPQKEPQ